MQWVKLSSGRRLMYGALGTVMLLIFVTVAWLDLQARSTGALDMACLGGTLAGGGFALITAMIGKEKKRVGGIR